MSGPFGPLFLFLSMIVNEIDITQSIRKGRLIKKKWLIEYFLDNMRKVVLVCIIPILPLLILDQQNLKGIDNTSGIILSAFSITLSILIILSFTQTNQLLRIKGIDKNTNRKNLVVIADKIKLTFFYNNQHQATLFPDKGNNFTFRSHEINVIYDKVDILINVRTTNGRGDVSPFHWFSNRKILKKIEKEFLHETLKLKKNT